MEKLSAVEALKIKQISAIIHGELDSTKYEQLHYLIFLIKNIGIADTDHIKQLLKFGLPIYDELMEIIDFKYSDDFNKFINDNNVTYSMISIAIDNMTGEGGCFYIKNYDRKTII